MASTAPHPAGVRRNALTEHTGASAASTRSTGASGSTAVGQDASAPQSDQSGTSTIKGGHGNSPAAWSTVGLMLVGFVVWAIGMVTGHHWGLAWGGGGG